MARLCIVWPALSGLHCLACTSVRHSVPPSSPPHSFVASPSKVLGVELAERDMRIAEEHAAALQAKDGAVLQLQQRNEELLGQLNDEIASSQLVDSLEAQMRTLQGELSAARQSVVDAEFAEQTAEERAAEELRRERAAAERAVSGLRVSDVTYSVM